MSKNDVEQKPSETAFFAALYRAIANKEFKSQGLGPDYLAESFLPSFYTFLIKFKTIRTRIKNKGRKLTPGIYEYMLTRTAFFDNVFKDALNRNIPQIVLLGAGYDTRAWRFEKLNNTTKIIELDIAATQNRKNKCLKKTQNDFPKCVTFAPIDFNNESLRNILEEAGYESKQRTLFIWEGVSYYLKPESVDATLEFVSNSSHNQSLIAFDYAISMPQEDIDNYYGVKEFYQTWNQHRSNEPFRFTVNEAGIGPFLEQRGLEIVNHLDNKEIEKTFLTNEDELFSGRINGMFRFVTASPKNK